MPELSPLQIAAVVILVGVGLSMLPRILGWYKDGRWQKTPMQMLGSSSVFITQATIVALFAGAVYLTVMDTLDRSVQSEEEKSQETPSEEISTESRYDPLEDEPYYPPSEEEDILNTSDLVISRDGLYRTIKFGTLTWMVEDITFDEDELGKIGFFTYEEAKKICARLGKDWRLPGIFDWASLLLQSDSKPNRYYYFVEGGKSGFNARTTQQTVSSLYAGSYWIYWDDNSDVIHEFIWFNSSKALVEFGSDPMQKYRQCRCVNGITSMKGLQLF